MTDTERGGAGSAGLTEARLREIERRLNWSAERLTRAEIADAGNAIVFLRDDVPWLLAECRRLAAEVARLTDEYEPDEGPPVEWTPEMAEEARLYWEASNVEMARRYPAAAPVGTPYSAEDIAKMRQFQHDYDTSRWLATLDALTSKEADRG